MTIQVTCISGVSCGGQDNVVAFLDGKYVDSDSVDLAAFSRELHKPLTTLDNWIIQVLRSKSKVGKNKSTPIMILLLKKGGAMMENLSWPMSCFGHWILYYPENRFGGVAIAAWFDQAKAVF